MAARQVVLNRRRATQTQGMKNFQAKLPATALASSNPGLRFTTYTIPVKFFATSDRAAIASATPWLIRDCAPDENGDFPENMTDHQICANYCSILCMTLSELEPLARQALVRTGAEIVEENIEDITERGYMGEDGDIWERNQIVVAIGQLIFLLYKNIAEANYVDFIRARTNAMKALVGLSGNLMDDDDVLFGLNAATIVSARLGADSALKKRVLEMALYMRLNADPPIGTLFTYITDILAWNEMSGFGFICENLLLPNSPVIRDVRVLGEMNRLKTTFEVLNNDPYPQYYRIMHEPHECSILNRSRFPTLMAVAQHVRPESVTPKRRFAEPKNIDAELVAQLVAIHAQHIIERGEVTRTKNIAYLTYFDDEPVFEEDVAPEIGVGDGPIDPAQFLAGAAPRP